MTVERFLRIVTTVNLIIMVLYSTTGDVQRASFHLLVAIFSEIQRKEE